MTAQQIQDRAIERARTERLRAFRLMDGTFAVKSRVTEPGAYHLVTAAHGEIRCDCPGYYYRQSCTHSAAVIRRIERGRRSTFAF